MDTVHVHVYLPLTCEHCVYQKILNSLSLIFPSRVASGPVWSLALPTTWLNAFVKCSSFFALEANGGTAVSCQDVQAPK